MGLMLVNSSELEHLRSSVDNTRSTTDYMLGCLVALCAVAAWTWYPIVNSRYLRAHPRINSMTWATAQGLATLPMALVGFVLYGIYNHVAGNSYDFPLGPRPEFYILMMLLIGLSASWIGTLLWNKASQLLPTALVAQLIVFETLAALLYAFLLRGMAPDMKILAGVVFLCVGVVFGVRTFSRQAPVSPPL
jgi:drug/metabolite transporter (DMT)-like permease